MKEPYKRTIKRNLLLISSAKVPGYRGYLESAISDINRFLTLKGITRILFIPYSKHDYDEYLNLISKPFRKYGGKYFVYSLHHERNEAQAIRRASAILVGGGNTYLLLKTLYDKKLISVLRETVLYNGTPYIGISAGVMIANETIDISPCRPVVQPPTMTALNLIPFVVTPHFANNQQTRSKKLWAFLKQCAGPVLGLREGSSVLIEGAYVTLKGQLNARIFFKDYLPKDCEPETDLSFLLRSPPPEEPKQKIYKTFRCKVMEW